MTERLARRAGGGKGQVLRLLEKLGKLRRGVLPANEEAQFSYPV